MYNQAYKAYKGLPKIEDKPKAKKNTGLLGRMSAPKEEQSTPDEPKMKVAKMVDVIRKQREALKNG
jgi:hypothetical protein